MMNRSATWLEAATALQYTLVPLAAIALASAIFEWTGFDLTSLGESVASQLPVSNESSISVRLRETEARTRWSVTVLLYLAIGLYFVGLGLSVLFRFVSGHLRTVYVVAVTVFVLAGLISLHLDIREADPVSAIFRFTFDLLSVSGRYDPDQLQTIRSILLLINGLAAVVPMVCIVAGSAIIAHCKAGSIDDVHALVRPARQLIQLLNVSSLMMVVGILHMNAWLHWPATLVNDSQLGKEIDAFASAVSLYWGAAFSLTIVAFYAPLARWLNRRAERCIATQGAADITDPARWLKEHHLSSSPIDQLPRIVTALAPFLAGPLGSALTGGVGL